MDFPILLAYLLACAFVQAFKISQSLISRKCRVESYGGVHRVMIRIVNEIINEKAICKLKTSTTRAQAVRTSEQKRITNVDVNHGSWMNMR